MYASVLNFTLNYYVRASLVDWPALWSVGEVEIHTIVLSNGLGLALALGLYTTNERCRGKQQLDAEAANSDLYKALRTNPRVLATTHRSDYSMAALNIHFHHIVHTLPHTVVWYSDGSTVRRTTRRALVCCLISDVHWKFVRSIFG